jgi:spore coat protein U-like protein
MRASRALRFAGVACLTLAAVPVAAATATASFAVTASVQATCAISTTPLAFGTYSGVQVDATSTILVTCTNTTPYNIGLGAGTGTGATVAARKMTGGAALLNYSLSRDSGRTLNWGTTVATDTLGGTGNGAVQPVTVYGRIAAGQFVAPGSYTDTIIATVTY